MGEGCDNSSHRHHHTHLIITLITHLITPYRILTQYTVSNLSHHSPSSHSILSLHPSSSSSRSNSLLWSQICKKRLQKSWNFRGCNLSYFDDGTSLEIKEAEEDTVDETFRNFWGRVFDYPHIVSSYMGLCCYFFVSQTTPLSVVAPYLLFLLFFTL